LSIKKAVKITAHLITKVKKHLYLLELVEFDIS